MAAVGESNTPTLTLFGKSAKLKKQVGLARKGWMLIGLKGTTAESLEDAIDAAKLSIDAMYSEATERVSAATFIFGRRTLGCVEFVNSSSTEGVVRQRFVHGT